MDCNVARQYYVAPGILNFGFSHIIQLLIATVTHVVYYAIPWIVA